MTTVSFPITLTGDYSDGSVCSASDYRADFEKLRDALNHMYERFSTIIISAHEEQEWNAQTIGAGTGHKVSYFPAVLGGYSANVGAHADGDMTLFETLDAFYPRYITEGGSASDTAPLQAVKLKNLYKIMKVIKVPSWMQGIRVRQIQVLNNSQIGTVNAADSSEYIDSDSGDGDSPLTFIVAKATNSGQMQVDNWTATTIGSVVIGNLGDESREGIWADAAASDNIVPDVNGIPETTANSIVSPGEWLVIAATGGIDLNVVKIDAGDQTLSRQKWSFDVNVLCDTMVPVIQELVMAEQKPNETWVGQKEEKPVNYGTEPMPRVWHQVQQEKVGTTTRKFTGGPSQKGMGNEELNAIINYYSPGGQGQYAADITSAIQGDIRGPGYAQAAFGTAGTGLPGAVGRIQKGQGAADRQAAIESGRQHRQVAQDAAKMSLMANQQLLEAGKLELQEASLLGEQYVGMVTMLVNSGMFDDYGPSLPYALQVQHQVYQQTGDAGLAMQAMYEAAGLGSRGTLYGSTVEPEEKTFMFDTNWSDPS